MDDLSLEHKSLQEGAQRVKFTCTRVDTCDERSLLDLKKDLAFGLQTLSSTRAAPVGPDGKLLGNCAAFVPTESQSIGKVLISRSGRGPDEPIDLERDFVCCVDFDTSEWRAKFRRKAKDDVKPSSDFPLHWYSLVEAGKACHWELGPKFVLHGHSFASVEDAQVLGVPISEEETLFSTKEDVDALRALLVNHSYPKHKVFIRKGHGFLIFSETMLEATKQLYDMLAKRDAAETKW